MLSQANLLLLILPAAVSQQHPAIITIMDLLLKAAITTQPHHPHTHPHPNNPHHPPENTPWNIYQQPFTQQPSDAHQYPERGHLAQEPQNRPWRQMQYKPGKEEDEVDQANHLLQQQSEYHSQPNKKMPNTAATKLNYLRMRNSVSEMKQAYFDLVQYLEDQKRLMEDFHEKICLDVEDYFHDYARKLHAETAQNQLHLHNENVALKQKIERKDRECQDANRELLQARREQLESTNSMDDKVKVRRMSSRDESQQPKCSNCKSLASKLTQATGEIRKSELQIQKLLIENQQLQETIFDIEQKLAGVDLEVERKLKEKLLTMPELQPDTNSTNTNNTELEALKAEIRGLQLKCHKLQQQAKNSSQFDSRMQQIERRQRQLNTYQGSLKEVEDGFEQMKQVNYERECQILQAEENLAKKIRDSAKKEAELSRWEAELTRKAAEVRNKAEDIRNSKEAEVRNNKAAEVRINLQPTLHNDQPPYRPKSITELQHSRQMSLKSFGKTHEMSQEDLELKLSPRNKQYYAQYENKRVHEPQRQYYETGKRRVEPKPYLQSQYASKNNLQTQYASKNREHYIPSRKIAHPTGSNYRDNRQAPPYHNVLEHRGRLVHGTTTQNAPHYRDLSKGSRHSAAKSIKSGYTAQLNAPKVRNQGQLTGLGSKLERLRQEIKKEIQSIK